MGANFSENLAKLRREKKVSQKAVAKTLGVSQALLSHYENGVREPGIDFLVKAAEYYGCSVDFLLGRTMDRSGISFPLGMSDDLSGNRLDPDSKYVSVTKKLLFNAVTLLIEIIKSSGNKALMNASIEYLQFTLYKLFRILCLYCENPDDFFSVPFDSVRPLTDALFKLNEYRFVSLCSDKKQTPVRLEYEEISGRYPGLWQSLISIIEKVDAMAGTLSGDASAGRGEKQPSSGAV